jgi:hypothetical protein
VSSNATPRRRHGGLIGGAIIGTYVVGTAIASVAELQMGVERNLFEHVPLLMGFAWFAILGGLIVARQPGNAMGWLLSAIGALSAVFQAGNAVASWVWLETGSTAWWVALLAWPNTWYWFALLALVMVFIPLVFPDGHLPSRRWRPLLWLAAAWTGALCLSSALGPVIEGQDSDMVLANPLFVPGMESLEHHPAITVIMGILIPGVVAAVTVKFRRSRGAQRQQLKWFLAAIALLPLTVLVELLAGFLPWGDAAGNAAFAIVINGIPLAIGIAVLRYRLYDIDRIISRTLAWGLITAALVGLYLGGVLLASRVLQAVGGSGDLAVAASTLAVAAAFQPVRGRIQSIVDRAFDRARYDAERTMEDFRDRLRSQVDLEGLRGDVLTAVRDTVAPAGATLWLRRGPQA